MNLIEGIVESIIAAVMVGVFVAGYRRYFGQQITITDPQENGYLSPVETRRGVQAHPVSGSLRHLPRNHGLWLIVADETSGKFWPQGFEPVEYNRATGTWKGYVTVFGWHRVRIFAVVAPPTSLEYFKYFQRVGQKTAHEPLLAIPQECRHRATIHAKVLPPAPIA